MALIKIWANGEDLTYGCPLLVELSKIREIESQGFTVEILDRKGNQFSLPFNATYKGNLVNGDKSVYNAESKGNEQLRICCVLRKGKSKSQQGELAVTKIGRMVMKSKGNRLATIVPQQNIQGKRGDVLTYEEKLAKAIALLKVDYMLSDEMERISNPKRNDNKYRLLCETWQKCVDLAKEYQGKLEGNDPDFPMDCHLIKLVFPTETEEIILREMRTKLADAISNCDEVNIDTDIKGNLQIHFGFENVYTPREV